MDELSRIQVGINEFTNNDFLDGVRMFFETELLDYSNATIGEYGERDMDGLTDTYHFMLHSICDDIREGTDATFLIAEFKDGLLPEYRKYAELLEKIS